MGLVLVIDDEESMLKLLEAHLTQRGFSVLTEDDPVKGLELAETGNPDFILLDIDMPGMSGIEVLKQLRKEKLTQHTPVIMLTAHGDKELVRECLTYGITDYLIKPYDPDKLAEKIRSALEWNAVHSVNAETISEPILISRAAGRLEIALLDRPASHHVLGTAAKLFGPVFMKQTHKVPTIFDLRNLTEMSGPDLLALGTIFRVFGDRELYVVAGRSFGQLLPVYEESTNVHIFLSPAEVEAYLGSRKSG